MHSRLVLLLPGFVDYTKFQNFFTDSDYIIAVDGGIEHSYHLSIQPNLWVGDFDSSHPDCKARFPDIPTEEFPTDKDYLDTELALSKAYSLNIQNCVMIGGIGGRLDHQLGLFMLIVEHPELSFMHTDGKTALYSLNNEIQREIDADTFKYLSLLPITTLQNVCLTGVKWPLNNAQLSPGKGLSISNEPLQEIIHYSQKQGLGWLILTNE